MLEAIASLGAYEVSIESANDPDGRWKKYVAAAPGPALSPTTARARSFAWPQFSLATPRSGPHCRFQSVLASRGDPSPLIDHRRNELGGCSADVGPVAAGRSWTRPNGGGVSLAIDDHVVEFPRHPAVEVSSDGVRYARVWEGSGAARTFIAVLRTFATGGCGLDSLLRTRDSFEFVSWRGRT
jgi:hypothetical protein